MQRSPVTTPDFPSLDREAYISLATFRRDGRSVRTPVWFARDGERLYVFTEGDAGKVKRLRNGSRAQVAACSVSGRVRGDWLDAHGRVVDDPGTEVRAYAALRAKYGWQMWAVDLFSRLAGRIEGRVILEIAPAGGHA
jgi:PPOX class probable F420-dependent enzyme